MPSRSCTRWPTLARAGASPARHSIGPALDAGPSASVAGSTTSGAAKRKRGRMEWKLELIQVPVSDIDEAKAFYAQKAGFTAEHDHQVSDEVRFVPLTPPGSACSIALTSGVHSTQPG